MARNLHSEITARVLSALKSGTIPWRQPWSASHTGSSQMPRNAATGRAYSGANVPLLWMTAQERGFEKSLWLTFKQALDLGGNVRKGEKGTTIIFVSSMVKEDEKSGEDIRVNFLKSFSVFNVAQCDGLPSFGEPDKVLNYDERDELADPFIAATGMDLRHGEARAYYRPAGDFVMMPRYESFIDASAYYSTLFHETLHWTGSEKRLAREFGKRFGDRAYSVEELTAEMGAAFMCAEFGFDNTMDNTAAYIAHWIKALESDEKIFVAACAAASKGVEFCRELALAAPVPAVHYDDAVLFNCCTDHKAPDWSAFAWLETGGCVDERDETTGETWTSGGMSDAEAQFWTVYGRLKEGGCEAITDCATRAEVDAIAAHLARVSGLPLEGPEGVSRAA